MALRRRTHNYNIGDEEDEELEPFVPKKRSSRSPFSNDGVAWAMLIFACFAAIGVIAFAITVPLLDLKYSGWNAGNIKTINAVSPTALGEVTATAGTGVLITPLPLTNQVQFDNTGVVTINGLSSSTIAHDIVIAATSPGLSVASAVNTVTLSNTGVTSLVAGGGVSLSNSTGAVTVSNTGVLTINGAAPVAGDFDFIAGTGMTLSLLTNTITVTHDISSRTQLANADAVGPFINYWVAIGFLTPVTTGGPWRTGLSPGFPNPFVPGAVGGDTGAGDSGGTGWAPDAVGTYTVSVDCDIDAVTGVAVDNLYVTAAVSFAAISEDPTTLAFIPSGLYSVFDIGRAASLTPSTYNPRINMASTFQVGCFGCDVQVGDPLAVHIFYESAGALGPLPINVLCRVQVGRVV